MESQLHRPVGHASDEDPHNIEIHSVVEDEGEEHHHDKKSVLKKVKDKAKKIKDKFTKDGHAHEHEPERHYAHDDHDEYEEVNNDNEAEEMVEDPEAHGAPMYESVASKNSVPAQAQAVNLEKPTAVGEDRYDDPRRVDRMEEKNVGLGQERPKIGVPGGLQEDPHSPKSGPGKIPPPNYETKVSDPSGEGGKEVDLNPLISSLDKMGVSEEMPGTESAQSPYKGSHDQFAPQSTPAEGEFDPKTSNSDTAAGKSSNQSGYVEKISVATSIIADKAISAKNAVASKLGYGGTESDKGQTEESKVAAGKSGASASPAEYVHKAAATVTEKVTPVYEKVAGAGSSVVSKVKGSGTGQEGAEISGDTAPDKGVSVKEYLAEKLKPSEEDKALSEVISDTLHKKKGDLVKSVESKPTGKAKTVESNPAGKVTESEEATRYLGSGMENKREGEDAIAAGKESSGSGVVDRLKGAVSSWISKGGEREYSKGSADSSYVSNQGPLGTSEVKDQPADIADEGRLQESGN